MDVSLQPKAGGSLKKSTAIHLLSIGCLTSCFTMWCAVLLFATLDALSFCFNHSLKVLPVPAQPWPEIVSGKSWPYFFQLFRSCYTLLWPKNQWLACFSDHDLLTPLNARNKLKPGRFPGGMVWCARSGEAWLRVALCAWLTTAMPCLELESGDHEGVGSLALYLSFTKI